MTRRLEANEDEIEMAILAIYPADQVGIKLIEPWFKSEASTRIATLDAWIQLLQQIKDSTEYEAELMK